MTCQHRTESHWFHTPYRVTDANGNTSTATIYIDIVDDVPLASRQSSSMVDQVPLFHTVTQGPCCAMPLMAGTVVVQHAVEGGAS
jgi:hypothetical protein